MAIQYLWFKAGTTPGNNKDSWLPFCAHRPDYGGLSGHSRSQRRRSPSAGVAVHKNMGRGCACRHRIDSLSTEPASRRYRFKVLILCVLVIPSAFVGAAHVFLSERGYFDWLFKNLHRGRYIDSEGVLFQHHVNEGGIMVLRMVLDRFEIKYSKEELIRLAGVEPHGTTMRGLQRAFEAKGLRADGWRLTYDALQTAPMPAIVLFNQDQYGVIIRFADAGGLIMLDPRWGRLYWKRDEFMMSWKGEVLLVTSDQNAKN